MPSTKKHGKTSQPLKPKYRGKIWVPVRLPKSEKEWADGGEKSIHLAGAELEDLISELRTLNDHGVWNWPKRKHYFFSDLHGDSEAFAASLVASGGVKKSGPRPRDFRLSNEGSEANFVIGGDCFDKGPSSLELLRTVRALIKRGARVRTLAGNHDIRVLLGMQVIGKKKDTQNEHFFVRTGQKIVPLLNEVWNEYLKGKEGLKKTPSESQCRERLMPRESWYDAFPKVASDYMLPEQRERELQKIRKKADRFEEFCANAGLNLRQVYAATQKWNQLFLSKKGEFTWFYKNLRLCYRSGSLLFVHAGVDDNFAKSLHVEGINKLNRTFREEILQVPGSFYYGPLCNVIRTKYRPVDRPFSKQGAKQLRKAGISAIVHGHRNLHNGQRLAFRKNVINFECDTSLDRNTRKLENVNGRGASVTIIEPEGYILGVSSDYPDIKVFHPRQTLKAISI